MAQGDHQPSWADEARRDVLSSPELVERILAQLETPLLILGSGKLHPDTTKRVKGDRWPPSQVSRAFRAAALRLPWRAELRDCGKETVSPAAAALCRGKAVTHLHLKLNQQTPAAEAALLCCGPSLDSLEVSTIDWLQWLRTTQLPLQAAAAGEGPVEHVPLLAFLSSLSRLRVLTLTPTLAWHDASWLTALPQLTSVELRRFAGAPVGGLPHLESLCVEHTNATQAFDAEGPQLEVTLEQWASPRLTNLCLVFYAVQIGSPPTTPSVKAWLHGLQTLELEDCHVKLQLPSLREVLPCLTCLIITHRQRKCNRCIDRVLSGGLPQGLKELQLIGCEISAPEQPWAALSTLRLETLAVTRTGMFLGVNEADLAIAALSAMPKLRRALLVLTTRDSLALEERFSGLEAQVAARGGRLDVGYVMQEAPGPDGDSIPSDEDPDPEVEPEAGLEEEM